MLEKLPSLDQLNAVLLLAIVVVNSLLTAVSAVLDFIKKPLGKDHWAFKIVTVLQKIVDFISANKKH
jgi:hypothetical protein